MALFNTILMVCVGNICRSPMAENLLRAALPAADIQVSSAGLVALHQHPLEATASRVLEEHGHTYEPHQARQLTSELVSAADLILVMEQWQIEAVLKLAPVARGKVFLLGKWQSNREIQDPYRRGKPAFLQAYGLIQQATQAWAELLAS